MLYRKRTTLKDRRMFLKGSTSKIISGIIKKKTSIEKEDPAPEKLESLEYYLKDFLKKILANLNADAGQISLVSGNGLILRAQVGLSQNWVREERIRGADGCLCGWVYRKKMPLAVTDLSSDDRFERKACLEEGMRGYMAVPLSSRNGIYGVLTVFSRTPRTFTKNELEFLNEKGKSLSIHLENFFLSEKEKKRKGEIEILSYVTKKILSTLDVDTIYSRVADLLYDVLDYPHVLIFEVDKRGNAKVKSWRGDKNFNTGNSKVMDWVKKNGSSLLIRDIRVECPQLMISEDMRSELCVPIKDGDRIIGGIHIMGKDPNSFDETDLKVLETISNLMVVALNNARIYKELHESEERYRTLVETSNDLIWMKDREGRVIFANRKAMELSGYTDEYTGKKFQFFVHPEDVKLAEDLNKKVLEGKPQQYTIRILKKNGDVLYLSVNSTPVYKNGKIIGTVSFARDITKEKKLQEEMTQRLVELETLFDMASVLRKAESLMEMCPVILKRLLSAVGADTGILYLLDKEREKLIPQVAVGPIQPMMQRPLHLKELPFIESAFKSGEADFIPNLSEDPRFPPKMTSFLRGNESGLILPIKTKEKNIGVVFLAFFKQVQMSREKLSLLSAIADMAANALQRARFHEEILNYADTLRATYESTLETLANALDIREHGTERHSFRVAELTVKIAREMGIEENKLSDIRWGALLHDIGKIGIPDSILLKPSKLTEDEWAIMKTHPEIGYRLLKNIRFLAGALDIVLYHHERYDGNGYPIGLRAKEIPLPARIFAVVDAYDAMTSDRPYRKAISHEEAIKEIVNASGKQFALRWLRYF
jgi:PAS domain S-box-containing protein/putative nucleotidyltransferase with HDIG domain